MTKSNYGNAARRPSQWYHRLEHAMDKAEGKNLGVGDAARTGLIGDGGTGIGLGYGFIQAEPDPGSQPARAGAREGQIICLGMGRSYGENRGAENADQELTHRRTSLSGSVVNEWRRPAYLRSLVLFDLP